MKIRINNFYKNKILLILLICIGFSVVGCGQPSLDKKRKTTMLKIVNAIKVNDTITISRLIDTANCFEIGSKETFYNSINRLFKKFSKDQIFTNVEETNFILSEERDFGTVYKLNLYTTEDNKKYYEIRMRFIGNTFDKVYYFNSLFHNDSPEILVAPPSK